MSSNNELEKLRADVRNAALAAQAISKISSKEANDKNSELVKVANELLYEAHTRYYKALNPTERLNPLVKLT